MHSLLFLDSFIVPVGQLINPSARKAAKERYQQYTQVFFSCVQHGFM
jgi:hypothetical protein